MNLQEVPAGPVDVAVVVFPESDLGSSVTLAIAEAIASGAVRLLDALIVRKDSKGKVTIVDIDDEDDVFTMMPVTGDQQGLLSVTDANEVSDGLEPGSTALIVAWENMWAIRLRVAIHDAGGHILAHERVSDADLVGAFATLAPAEGK